MSAELNLPLRTKILEIALNIEQNVTSILLIYLSIEHDERKAISNKSGNLSFKNKIDLLYDLEIFNKEEHRLFLLLMEYRNQFLHNIECNSFVSVVSFLGVDKGKSLLKFNSLTEDVDHEKRYENAFDHLYHESIRIALKKIRARQQLIKEKNEGLQTLVNKSTYLIDFFFDIVDKLFEQFEPKDLDSRDVIATKVSILGSLAHEIQQLSEKEEYKLLKTRLNNSFTEDKLKTYFK